MIYRRTSISAYIVEFCRFLRSRGFRTGAVEEATALTALQYISFSRREEFDLALKAVLCRSKSELDQFDGLYQTFTKEKERGVDAKIKEEQLPSASRRNPEQEFKALKSWLHGNRHDETEETAAWSVQEGRMTKDFSLITEEEKEEWMQAVRSVANRLARQVSRRYERSLQSGIPDLRRTIRKNLRTGGELVHLVHRKPARNRVNMVILCDVSKSMELYSAFLIQFMYAFQQVFRKVETFVFSTSLERITPILRQKSFKEAMEEISRSNSGWGGGTRIGEAFRVFNETYAGLYLNNKTTLLILSDGWDLGETDLLEKNLSIMYRKVNRLIWLNPLLGNEHYRPETAAMKAALPYTDVFAPVHNLESLRGLVKWL